MRNATLLLISAIKPFVLAVYDERNELIEQHASDQHLTTALYMITSEIDARYCVTKVAYIRGPGSFMGLKLGFVFMRSFALARGIDFTAADSFALTADRPVFSHKNRYFVKENGVISVQRFDQPQPNFLIPPLALDTTIFNADTLPQYILGAI